MPVVVLLLAVLLAFPCGGAIDLCACSGDEHGLGCEPVKPQAAAQRSCCSSETEAPQDSEHPTRCPGCPTLELPELPSSVAPSWSNDSPPTSARARLIRYAQLPLAASSQTLQGVEAWPPPDPVPLYLSLRVIRL